MAHDVNTRFLDNLDIIGADDCTSTKFHARCPRITNLAFEAHPDLAVKTQRNCQLWPSPRLSNHECSLLLASMRGESQIDAFLGCDAKCLASSGLTLISKVMLHLFSSHLGLLVHQQSSPQMMSRSLVVELELELDRVSSRLIRPPWGVHEKGLPSASSWWCACPPGKTGQRADFQSLSLAWMKTWDSIRSFNSSFAGCSGERMDVWNFWQCSAFCLSVFCFFSSCSSLSSSSSSLCVSSASSSVVSLSPALSWASSCSSLAVCPLA